METAVVATSEASSSFPSAGSSSDPPPVRVSGNLQQDTSEAVSATSEAHPSATLAAPSSDSTAAQVSEDPHRDSSSVSVPPVERSSGSSDRTLPCRSQQARASLDDSDAEAWEAPLEEPNRPLTASKRPAETPIETLRESPAQRRLRVCRERVLARIRAQAEVDTGK